MVRYLFKPVHKPTTHQKFKKVLLIAGSLKRLIVVEIAMSISHFLLARVNLQMEHAFSV